MTYSAITPCSPMVMAVTPVSPSLGASRQYSRRPPGRIPRPANDEGEVRDGACAGAGKPRLQPVKVARQGSPAELSHERIVEAVTVGGRGDDLVHIRFGPSLEVPIKTSRRTVQRIAGIGGSSRIARNSAADVCGTSIYGAREQHCFGEDRRGMDKAAHGSPPGYRIATMRSCGPRVNQSTVPARQCVRSSGRYFRYEKSTTHLKIMLD